MAMKTVYDVRLNNYAGQIVWQEPMINDYGDIYGYSYFAAARWEDPQYEEPVIIGFDKHGKDCYCDRCRGISNVYDQIHIDPNLSPTHNFTW